MLTYTACYLFIFKHCSGICIVFCKNEQGTSVRHFFLNSRALVQYMFCFLITLSQRHFYSFMSPYFHIFTIYNFVNCNKMIYLFIFLPYCSTYCSRTKYYLSILPAEHKYEKLLCVKTVTTMKLFIIYETQKKYIMYQFNRLFKKKAHRGALLLMY